MEITIEACLPAKRNMDIDSGQGFLIYCLQSDGYRVSQIQFSFTRSR